MLIIADGDDLLRALDWEDHEPRMQRLLCRHYGANAVRLRDTRRLSAARRALAAYFAGDLRAIADVPTTTKGTVFQRTVWYALRRIPIGQTPSYGAMAAQTRRRPPARALGTPT